MSGGFAREVFRASYVAAFGRRVDPGGSSVTFARPDLDAYGPPVAPSWRDMSARRWRVRDAYGGAVFALDAHVTSAERARALPRHRACAIFDAWCPEGHAPATVAELAVALGGRLSDDAASLRHRARGAVCDGRVLALREARTDVRAPAGATETPAPEPASSATMIEAVKTWITIRLVHDDDPARPVAYARYRIRLPDDAVREGRLDAMGTAHFEGIDPGSCRVSFPDYDGDAWGRAG